jgi:hypothetical protein
MGFFDDEVVLDNNGVELMFNLNSYLIQVGMGGEWWSGRVKAGKNVLKHRKEDIDEAYRPVVVFLTELNSFDIELRITGGFGMEANFKLGKDLPKNKFH